MAISLLLFQKELAQPLMGKTSPAETINEFYEGIWEGRFADVLDYKHIFLKEDKMNEKNY